MDAGVVTANNVFSKVKYSLVSSFSSISDTPLSTSSQKKKILVYINNTYSTLSEFIPDLEKLFTIAYPNFWFSQKFKMGIWDGHYHFLKKDSLKFPSGLLSIAENYFSDNNIDYEIIDRRASVDIEENPLIDVDYIPGITLRDYQLESINIAIERQRGVLELPTGSGKTEVAAAIIKALNLKTLFLVHTRDLLNQTVERFEKRLNKKIGKIGDGEFEDNNVVVATVQSLMSLKEKDESAFKKYLLEFSVLFIDECHHASTESHYTIAMYMHNAYFRYGLSGTILRRDVLSNAKMLAAIGDPIYRLKTIELIEKGDLCNITIYIIDVDQQDEIENVCYQKIYKDNIVESNIRNEKIIEIVEQKLNENRKIMILVRIIKHGNILKKLLEQKNISCEFLSGKDSSKERTEIKKEFDSNKTKNFVLIASTIFSEGVDIPNINTLIIATGGTSAVRTIQQIGRGLRKKDDGSVLEVFDFNDKGKYIDRHSLEREIIYRTEDFLR